MEEPIVLGLLSRTFVPTLRLKQSTQVVSTYRRPLSHSTSHPVGQKQNHQAQTKPDPHPSRARRPDTTSLVG
jgi:hypothetical protein